MVMSLLLHYNPQEQPWASPNRAMDTITRMAHRRDNVHMHPRACGRGGVAAIQRQVPLVDSVQMPGLPGLLLVSNAVIRLCCNPLTDRPIHHYVLDA